MEEPTRPERSEAQRRYERLFLERVGVALAELTRLVEAGLDQEEAEALMRRAGWGRRGGPEPFIGP